MIETEKNHDERGFFSRSFCIHEFEKYGLNPRVAQCNISFNKHKGTLRGMHSQAAPYEEAKLVRCTKGAIFDVALDLRPDSVTFLKHIGAELTEDNHKMMYVPEGVYHGFLTLRDNTEVFYQMSEFYMADKALGVRYNDPAFGIIWPSKVRVISEKDLGYADFLLTNE